MNSSVWLPQTEPIWNHQKTRHNCPVRALHPCTTTAKFHASGRSLSRPWKTKSALADWKSLPTRWERLQEDEGQIHVLDRRLWTVECRQFFFGMHAFAWKLSTGKFHFFFGWRQLLTSNFKKKLPRKEHHQSKQSLAWMNLFQIRDFLEFLPLDFFHPPIDGSRQLGID